MTQSTQFVVTDEDKKTVFAGTAKEVVSALDDPSTLGYPRGKQVADNLDDLEVYNASNNSKSMAVDSFLRVIDLDGMEDEIKSIQEELSE